MSPNLFFRRIISITPNPRQLSAHSTKFCVAWHIDTLANHQKDSIFLKASKKMMALVQKHHGINCFIDGYIEYNDIDYQLSPIDSFKALEKLRKIPGLDQNLINQTLIFRGNYKYYDSFRVELRLTSLKRYLGIGGESIALVIDDETQFDAMKVPRENKCPYVNETRVRFEQLTFETPEALLKFKPLRVSCLEQYQFIENDVLKDLKSPNNKKTLF